MRMDSVAAIKGRRYTPRRIPKEGSCLRAIFDAFQPPCTVVHVDELVKLVNPKIKDIRHRKRAVSDHIEHLRESYCLDIRYRGKGHKGEYWLVGEYTNQGDYIDYLAERLDGTVRKCSCTA